MHHTLVALVEDRPGVLNRVASLFRRRAFNIESLSVGRTAEAGISRMTIVIETDQPNADRVSAYLCKLINVLHVEHLGAGAAVARDLALVKVAADTADRAALHRAVDETRAHIVDYGERTMTLEITGEPPHVDAVIGRLAALGIVEMARTGQVAMRRGDTAMLRGGRGNAEQAERAEHAEGAEGAGAHGNAEHSETFTRSSDGDDVLRQ